MKVPRSQTLSYAQEILCQASILLKLVGFSLFSTIHILLDNIVKLYVKYNLFRTEIQFCLNQD